MHALPCAARGVAPHATPRRLRGRAPAALPALRSRPAARPRRAAVGARASLVPPAVGAVAAPPAPAAADKSSALRTGLGDFGEVPTALLPHLLRLADIRAAAAATPAGATLSAEVPTLSEAAAGIRVWGSALEIGVLPTEQAFANAAEHGGAVPFLPREPLRSRLVATVAALGITEFTPRYAALRAALLVTIARAAVTYAALRRKALAGETEEEAAGANDGSAPALDYKQTEGYKRWAAAQQATARAAADAAAKAAEDAGGALISDGTGGAYAAAAAAWSGDPDAAALADKVADAVRKEWAPAAAALRRAGAAFAGLDEVLGGSRGTFDVADPTWSRKGWGELERHRRTLEDCKELRDLVRRLGRGAGWGPLRLSPTQRFDEKARDGLLRDPLEAAETRSLTRGGDISMMLPAEASLFAKGRSLRVARLLFHARRAERALLSYARDGWAVLPASDVAPWIREVRPTAERGPILLCLDSSGSMRGAREAVAKALALECMRAARVQERGCYCFAFSGPAVIEEIELASDPAGLARLFAFLERPFNGGSDLNAPLAACVGRLATAEWSNSDILIVSDGELRQPSEDVLRKIGGAKEALGLRIHGLQLPVNAVIGHAAAERDTGALRARPCAVGC
jgi:hypothetical protein